MSLLLFCYLNATCAYREKPNFLGFFLTRFRTPKPMRWALKNPILQTPNTIELILRRSLMIPNKLIEAVVIFVFMAAAAGQLPKLVKSVQIAQYRILKDSQSSNWGRAMLLPIR